MPRKRKPQTPAQKRRTAERQRAWEKANRPRLRALATAWRKRNPDKVKKISRDYYCRHRDELREKFKHWWYKEGGRERHENTRLLRLYGITVAQRDTMLAAQGGKCAICPKRLRKGRFHIDHCHTTGNVRGLLCQQCNQGLGNFGDNADNLKAAAAYLARSK